MDDTENNTKTQNKELKELTKKIRSASKLCCDFVLFFIIIGLIMVLYNLIKEKI